MSSNQKNHGRVTRSVARALSTARQANQAENEPPEQPAASAATTTPAAAAKKTQRKAANKTTGTSKRKAKGRGRKPSSAAGSKRDAAAAPPAEADVLPGVPPAPRVVADAADFDGGNVPAAGPHMVPTTPNAGFTGGHANGNPKSEAVNVVDVAGLFGGMDMNASQQLLNLGNELKNTKEDVANLKGRVERYAETNGQRWARNDIEMAEMKRQLYALTPKRPH